MPYQPYPQQAMPGQQMPAQQYGYPPPGQPYAQPGAFAGAPPAAMPAGGPIPPSMHWVVVWLLGAVTLGIFIVVWVFKQANFVKRLDPSNPSRTLLIITLLLGAAYGIIVAVAVTMQSQAALAIGGGVGVLVELAAVACNLIAYFKMRSSLVRYYNTVEPIGLRLSGVMTFFFNILYFQHHFRRIAQWKQTGVLTPQK
jgi:hypothetical protein